MPHTSPGWGGGFNWQVHNPVNGICNPVTFCERVCQHMFRMIFRWPKFGVGHCVRRSAFGVRENYPCRRMCPTTWTDSKWRPVSSKRDGCLMPNLIGTCFCGAKNGKKTCYRILDCREMGVEVLEVTITWTIRAWRYTALHRVYMRKTAI